MLTEQRRLQLDKIVSQMISNNESDQNIQFVVDDFKAKYDTQPQQPNEKKNILDKAGDFIGATQLGKGLAAFGFQFTPEAKMLKQLADEGRITPEEYASVASGGMLTDITQEAEKKAKTQVAGSAAQTAGTILSLGKSPLTSGSTVVGQGAKTFLKTAGTQAAKTAAVGGTLSAMKSIATRGDTDNAVDAFITGALLGAGVSATMSVGKLALSKLPTLLARTSGVPKGALKQQMAEPGAIDKARPLSEVVKDIQSSVRQARSDLTKSYAVEEKKLIDSLTGVRSSLSSKSKRNLIKVAEKYDISDVLPQNLDKISVREANRLTARINTIISKGTTAKSPEGFLARETRDLLKSDFSKSFGDDYTKFMSNYADKKKALDAINEITNAFAEGSPRKRAAAEDMLRGVFNENKSAYQEAVLDFAKKSGNNFINDLARAQTVSFLPKPSGQFSGNDLFRMILFPITSPKIAGLETRAIGRVIGAGSGQAGTTIKSLGRLFIPKAVD